LPSTHPIAADIPDIAAVEQNFDGITYAKGAAVLKQLVAYVGRENFLDGMRKYFAAHAWGNATLADLLAALEETSGRDLAAWSAEWLQQAGVNTLRPSYQVDADGRFTEFAVEQVAARDYVRLVLSGISSVADISVVQTLLRQASLAVRRLADPGWRETGLALMASTLRGLLDGAPAGSDVQLAYVRAFAGVAASAE